MKASVASVTIVGIAPMTHSHQHGEPRFEGETHDDYDARTWRSKLNTETRDGKQVIVIPAHGFHQMLEAAARYSKRQIPGQGKATWTAKFSSGLALLANPVIEGIDPATVSSITISANVDGKRGSGKRVLRRFPVIPMGWRSTVEVYVLDPIITKSIFEEMLELAGIYVGLGQFAPRVGGTNGRFRIEKLVWTDNRQMMAA